MKLRQIELQHSEMSLRLEETEAELRLRDQERERLESEKACVRAEGNKIQGDNDRLIRERQSLINAADKVINANREIEDEIEEMLRCDDKIKQSLEIRDRKMSPVVKQTKEQALALQETLNQSAYLSNNSRVLSPEQKMKLALPLKQMVTEPDPVVRTEQNSQRDSRWNLLTKESPGSGMLRYLNPRCL